MTVFITGDRSLSPVYGALAAIEMLRAQAQGHTVTTTDMDGVAAVVRDLAQRAGVEIDVLPAAEVIDPTEFSEVIAIHVDPHSSSVVKALLDAPNLRIVTHADLMV